MTFLAAERPSRFTLAMIGFACGGVLMARLADRFGVLVPLLGATVSLAVGYAAAGLSKLLWQLALAYGAIGVFGCAGTFVPLMADVCLAAMMSLSLLLRGLPPRAAFPPAAIAHAETSYGVARGAQMLSLMLGFGIVSRIASGFVADRIGGLATLLIGSIAQMAALALYLLMNGLLMNGPTSLFVISALFGLFQGGIVPSYAIIVRECFPPSEAGARTGVLIMATLFGMALGAWMSGATFDVTGSYGAAFANGIVWNLANTMWLLLRGRRPASVVRGQVLVG